MLSLVLALTLVVATPKAPSPAKVATHSSSGSRSATLSVLTSPDGTTATALLGLARGKPPNIDAYAEYMSIGPLGAVETKTDSGAVLRFEQEYCHRLRVTLAHCERIVWMLIDDVITGQGDTRSIHATYRMMPYFSDQTDPLWTALQGASRVLGAGPTGPPIVWHSPTTFSWITSADTLTLEQKADSLFQVTIRARTR